VAKVVVLKDFDADPAPVQGQWATDNPVIAGFLSQVAAVKVALEATIAQVMTTGLAFKPSGSV